MSFINNLLEQTGTGAAAELTGGAIGQIFGAMNDNRQLTQQRHLQNLQLEGQKGMMDYAYQKQLDMWNQTNYPAQMEQLEKAGLNPGLMYAKGGPGGVTGTPAGNVTGGQAQQNPGEATAAMGIMNQNALMESQRKLMEAQAKETNVRADKEAGVDTKVGQAQEASLLQGVENAKAQEALTKIETAIKNVQLNFDTDTQNNRESIINMTLSNMTEEVAILRAQKQVDQATVTTKIQQAKANLALTVLEQYQTSASTKNITQDIQLKIAQEKESIGRRLQGWKNTGINEQQLDQQNTQWLNDTDQSGFPQELKDLLKTIILFKAVGGSSTTKTITGFHKR